MLLYERCLCVYQTINDEVDGAVEDYEAPVKLLKIVSQQHSIPRDDLSLREKFKKCSGLQEDCATYFPS